MRVTLVRGRARVVVVVSSELSDSSASWSSSRVRGARVLGVVVVVSDSDVVVGSAGSMSVVAGGLVLVTLEEVVVRAVDRDVLVGVDERLVSVKYIGACVGSDWRVTYMTADTTTAIAANAAMLAPSSVDVRLCHATDSRPSSSRSRLATAADSSGGTGPRPGQRSWGITWSAKSSTCSRSDMSRTCR